MSSSHQRIAVSVTAIASFLAGGLAACGPSPDPPPEDAAARYGATLCEALASCGCYFPYDGAEECEDDYSGRMAKLLERDMDFDEDCFETALETATFDACALASEVPFAQDCDLLLGSKQRGEECSGYFGEVAPFGVDECEGELVCRAGYCRGPEDVLPRLEVGDDCDPTEFAQFCQSDPDEILYCAVGGTCQAQVGAGASCDSPNACSSVELPETYCQGFGAAGEGVCAVEHELGEACDPADYGPCAFNPGANQVGWCSPVERVCVTDGPRVCNFPFHR